MIACPQKATLSTSTIVIAIVISEGKIELEQSKRDNELTVMKKY